MENIGTIISILVGLVTLLSMLVWFGRFIQRVNVHDKKLDEVSSDMYDIKKLVTIHDSKMDAISKNVGALRLDVYVTAFYVLFPGKSVHFGNLVLPVIAQYTLYDQDCGDNGK